MLNLPMCRRSTNSWINTRPLRQLRRLADVMLGAGGFGLWPMMTTPNTPGELLRSLRGAFAKALASGEFLAEAKRKPSKSN